MAKRKLILAFWICGLSLVAVSIPRALADTDFTYMFTANPGQMTYYNGTTFEINVSQLPPGQSPPPDLWFTLLSLHMYADIEMGAWGGDLPYAPPAPASSTPSSFSTSYLPGNLGPDCMIGAASAAGWQGGFDGGYGGYTPPGCPALNYFVGSSRVELIINSGGDGQPFNDQYASGTWSLVPDASSSIELLAMGIIALGTGRHLLRKPVQTGQTVVSLESQTTAQP
jgi:hypothetical protein